MEFFIIKDVKQPPVYRPIDDICYLTLEQACSQAIYFAKVNNKNINDYHILKILPDPQQILNCIFAAANSQTAKIDNYIITGKFSVTNNTGKLKESSTPGYAGRDESGGTDFL